MADIERPTLAPEHIYTVVLEDVESATVITEEMTIKNGVSSHGVHSDSRGKSSGKQKRESLNKKSTSTSSRQRKNKHASFTGMVENCVKSEEIAAESDEKVGDDTVDVNSANNLNCSPQDCHKSELEMGIHCTDSQTPANDDDCKDNNSIITTDESTSQCASEETKEKLCRTSDFPSFVYQPKTNAVRSRKSYSRELKLEVIAWYKDNGRNRNLTCRKFGIPRKCMTQWLRMEEVIYSMAEGKRARRGGKELWPDMEDELYKKYIEAYDKGEKIRKSWFEQEAVKIMMELHPESDFKFSAGWYRRFKIRKNIK